MLMVAYLLANRGALLPPGPPLPQGIDGFVALFMWFFFAFAVVDFLVSAGELFVRIVNVILGWMQVLGA